MYSVIYRYNRIKYLPKEYLDDMLLKGFSIVIFQPLVDVCRPASNDPIR